MRREIRLGERLIGDGQPAYIIAEIGINHNGELDIARKMMPGTSKFLKGEIFNKSNGIPNIATSGLIIKTMPPKNAPSERNPSRKISMFL